MKIPFKWLGDYVDLTGITPEQLADRLTAVGVAVEHVEHRNQGITGVVVGRIEQLEPHPNADRLRVAQVEVGQPRRLQIVTGAPNVSAGQCVPVAVEGANLAGGLSIKKSKLRGLESHGMMCSADELGILIKDLPQDQREGVLIFPPDTPPGADVLALLGIDEIVLHLEPFANRPDILSLIGVAREVSAALGRPLKPIDTDIQERDIDEHGSLRVEVTDKNLCPRYTARVIEGVKMAASPLWLAGRLQAAGMRSVNNVVDITNYVMLETGQPLHAFDLEKISGARIVARPAAPDEKLMCIDGVERTLDERALVIADERGPVAIAGVMGGRLSEVSDRTARVLLESACFSAASVRRTSTRLALKSESSRRFEKGLDWHGVDLASRRAALLLSTLCGGRQAQVCLEDGVAAPVPVRVGVRLSRVDKVLGVSIPIGRVREILQALHFQIDAEEADRLNVNVPSWRPDVRREEDLIEEVARHFGYDNIPPSLPSGVTQSGRTNAVDGEEENIRNVLAGLGLYEALTLSLLHPSSYDRIRMPSTGGIAVENPLIADQSQLRTTLLPHLMEAVLHNLNARAEHVELFELSKIYLAREDGQFPQEARRLAIVVAGRKHGRVLDFFHAKGILQAFFNSLGIHVRIQSPECEPPRFFHPGKTAEVVFSRSSGGNGSGAAPRLGKVGAVHPAVLATFDTTVEIVAAELDLDRILDLRGGQGWVRYRPISRNPSLQRDIAVVVAEDVSSGRVVDELSAAAGTSLIDVQCFDVYRGPQIAEGHKSLAYSLTFQQPDRTLTDAEVDKLINAILTRVSETLGARLRT